MTINSRLLNEYRRLRQLAQGGRPIAALTQARVNLATHTTNTCVVFSSFFPSSEIGAPFHVGGVKLRWIENFERNGFRKVGFADEIVNLRHKGWFVDNESIGDVARGMVVQIAARRGQAIYFEAIADPYNDNAIMLAVDALGTDKDSAARAADWIAQRYAEKEREYQEASAARCHYDDLAAGIDCDKQTILQLIAEIRTHSQAIARGAPAVCKALRDT